MHAFRVLCVYVYVYVYVYVQCTCSVRAVYVALRAHARPGLTGTRHVHTGHSLGGLAGQRAQRHGEGLLKKCIIFNLRSDSSHLYEALKVGAEERAEKQIVGHAVRFKMLEFEDWETEVGTAKIISLYIRGLINRCVSSWRCLWIMVLSDVFSFT